MQHAVLHVDPSPAYQRPDYLMVLFHGYGATGENLLDLAPALRRFTTQTVQCVVPDGIAPWEQAPALGRQWFSLQDMSPEVMCRSMERLLPTMHHWLDECLTRYHCTNQNLILGGFSQGAMLALSLAFSRSEPCLGVLSFSGMLLEPSVKPWAGGQPSVFLSHGMQDTVLPYIYHEQSRRVLEKSGVELSTCLEPLLGHSTNEACIRGAVSYLRSCVAHAEGGIAVSKKER